MKGNYCGLSGCGIETHLSIGDKSRGLVIQPVVAYIPPILTPQVTVKVTIIWYVVQVALKIAWIVI